MYWNRSQNEISFEICAAIKKNTYLLVLRPPKKHLRSEQPAPVRTGDNGRARDMLLSPHYCVGRQNATVRPCKKIHIKNIAIIIPAIHPKRTNNAIVQWKKKVIITRCPFLNGCTRIAPCAHVRICKGYKYQSTYLLCAIGHPAPNGGRARLVENLGVDYLILGFPTCLGFVSFGFSIFVLCWEFLYRWLKV